LVQTRRLKLGFSLSLKRCASHLLQRGNVYYFRLNIPADLQHIFAKREFKYKLGRIPLNEARDLANVAGGTVKSYFKHIRAGKMSHLTERELAEVVEKEVRELLTLDLRQRVNEKEGIVHTGSHPSISEEKYGLRAFDWTLPIPTSYLNDMKKDQDWRYLRSAANDIIQKNDLNIAEDSWQFKYLCFELCTAMYWFNFISDQRDAGIYDNNFPNVPLVDGLTDVSSVNQENNTSTTFEQEKEFFKLSDVIQAYLNEGKDNWGVRTFNEYKACLELLKRIIGDLPVNEITRIIMHEFKNCIAKLPSNMNKGNKYMGKSIEEITALTDNTISTTTVNKHLTRASQCFKWAVLNGYMDNNPAENISIKNKKRPQQQRAVFGIEDLNKIFHSEEYIGDKFIYSYQFYLPIIALFTGMRIEEISQLHLEDIYYTDGVWVFDLFEKRDERRKTDAGQRFMPLHPFLSNTLNIPQRKNYLEQKGYVRLFPELKKNKYDQYSQASSKWFNERYKTKIGITGKGKTFHSFRHTFVNHLKQKAVNEYMLMELDGHELQGETLGRYGKKYQPNVLYENVIKYIDFEKQIDLSHLKNSKYVLNTDKD